MTIAKSQGPFIMTFTDHIKASGSTEQTLVPHNEPLSPHSIFSPPRTSVQITRQGLDITDALKVEDSE